MWRFAILISIAPFVVGGIMANIFGLRILNRKSYLSLTVDQILQKILTNINRQDIKLEYTKKTLWDIKVSTPLNLPASFKDSKKASHAASALNHLGMYLLSEKHQATVQWRLKAIKAGYLLPIFVLLITVFSSIVGKLPAMISIAVVSASLGFCTASLWFSLGVAKEAAHQMASRVEKMRILARLSEEEELVSAIKACPWASLIPGALFKLIPKD